MEDDGKSFWTLDGGGIAIDVVRIETATGRIARRIPVADIVSANSDIDILEVGEDADWNDVHTSSKGKRWFTQDPFHLNDVEPLPASIADRFPEFKPGDLLLSARHLNLIFVMDPITLKVRWWESGAWRRQHDPDWQPNGEITLLDNRTGRGSSRIVSINPQSREVRVLFDGRKDGFYTHWLGKHQITPFGNILVTSPAQGRAFEIDANGKLVFDLINTRPGDKNFDYMMTEAIWLPLDFFYFPPTCHAWRGD